MNKKHTLTCINDLKPAPYNPRRIDDDAKSGLTVSTSTFGDLSGIVWNSRSGNLVAGHQRMVALKANSGDGLTLDSVVTTDPDGEHYQDLITPKGKRFRVRVVDWDLKREKAANLTANNPHIQGEFTDDVQGMLGELQDLPEFEELKLDALDLAVDLSEEPPSSGKEEREPAILHCPKCGFGFNAEA